MRMYIERETGRQSDSEKERPRKLGGDQKDER